MSQAVPNRQRLGVNVDHVATVRQARGTRYPEPVAAAHAAELAGADQITVHLREDRRHIQDRDVRILRETVQTRLNLEMAATDEMLAIARAVGPDVVTLVPEKREEQTTEGGLECSTPSPALRSVIDGLRAASIPVSLFIDPDEAQVEGAAALDVHAIELHTGDFAEAEVSGRAAQLARIQRAAKAASRTGLYVAAGHGLDYENTRDVAQIRTIEELNIGHSIVARALSVGFYEAVAQMLAIMRGAR